MSHATILREPSLDWHTFSPIWWELILQETAHRDRLDGQNPRRVWTPNYQLTGVCAEAIYALRNGLALQHMERLSDGGADYYGVDVKGTTYYRDPWLKRDARDPMKCDAYCLCAVDLQPVPARARIVGFATRLQLRAAPLRQYGHGGTHTLHWRDLDRRNPLVADAGLARVLGSADDAA